MIQYQASHAVRQLFEFENLDITSHITSQLICWVVLHKLCNHVYKKFRNVGVPQFDIKVAGCEFSNKFTSYGQASGVVASMWSQ